LPFYGSCWPGALCPAERLDHYQGPDLKLQNRLGKEVCMLWSYTLSHAGFVNGGGWNVWCGWWYQKRTNLNNLLIVNPEKNKQAVIMV